MEKKRAIQEIYERREGAVAVRLGEVCKAEIASEVECLTVKLKKGKWNEEGMVQEDGEKAVAESQPRQPQ